MKLTNISWRFIKIVGTIYAIYRKNNWAVIFNENGEIMTSYKIEKGKKSFEELHKEVGGIIKKGDVNERVKRAFEKLRNRYKNLGE